MAQFSQQKIVEFGSGDGMPVINAFLRTRYNGFIQGYEINPVSCESGKQRIRECKIDDYYDIFNGSFFDHANRLEREFMISNPPYLPSPVKDLILPSLYGGDDGTLVIKELISLNFNHVLMLIPSISNPLEVLRHAEASGYGVSDFLLTELPFGPYSSQDIVRRAIDGLKEDNKAFFYRNGYLIAGVLFQKKDRIKTDRSHEITRIMQCLK